MFTELEKLRYPIGVFAPKENYTKAEIALAIETIANLPKTLRKVVANFDEQQLETPYRPEGWTVRQTIHHLADSHIMAYIRFKLAATEPQTPVINPYLEQVWAEMADGKTAPIEISLAILDNIHLRWTMFLQNMAEETWKKGYFHPAKQRFVPLSEAVHNYAWHSEHHKAHITNLASSKGW
jgi:hypothetical protein